MPRTAEESDAGSRALSWQRRWFDVHSWIGLKLSILMSFILVTGTIAVFSYEIDWLLNPEMRAFSEVDARPASWGTLYDSATAAYPDGELRFLQVPHGTWWASQATLVDPAGGLMRIWLHPQTARYQGATRWFNVQRFLRQAHRHLMLPTRVGIVLVSLLALPLLLSLITGLITYKRFWRGWWKWPRFDRAPRIWLGDLHRWLGLWAAWFVLLIGLTSVWYLVEVSGGSAPAFPNPAPVATREAALPQGFDGAALDRAVAMAQAQAPDLKIMRISLPGQPAAPVSVFGQRSALLVRPRANAIHVDPLTLTVMGEYRGEQLSVHQRLSEMADPLHFGTWGGLASRLVRFVFGLALSALSITGIYIYGLRVLKRSRHPRWPQTVTAR